MKFLNLDEVASVTRTFKYKDVTYDIPEMSVENFIATTRDMEVNDGKGLSESEQWEFTLRLLGRSIPALPEEVARTMSMEQLGVLMRFINGQLDEGKAAAAVAAEEEAKAEGKQ